MMKTTILKISTFILLFSLMGAGCEKEEEQINNATIQKEIDGIKFKFCLLNEQRKPDTIFNQGENFSFYFSVTNNSPEKYYFYPGYAYYNDVEFCKVYDSNSQSKGKPYKVNTVLDIGAGAYPFDIGDSYIFEQPWADDRDSIWDWGEGTFESTHQKPLDKGNYYTEFQYVFGLHAPIINLPSLQIL